MVKIRVQMIFFDDASVLREVDRAKRRVLGKAGSFIRRTVKSSIRKRKRPSAPGKPPSSHKGDLKRLVFFAYDHSTGSVVIGPLRFKEGNVPRILEFGGRTTTRSVSSRRPRNVTVQKRPFMGPAMVKELPNFPKLWRGQVGGARA